ncbi:hypothetical protein [Methylomonas koyamae]|uniref:hypothetical protein n=1 Tax=Methylomonas koyamae TaxID=702114 RepID=UPI000BC347B0|nr:hypothetical protein [Methylomonas koyamae]ATG92566.1 hypothetical protein MKLM6_4408 [Methylomonas koyamae]
MKDYISIIVSTIAAFFNIHLSSKYERENKLWEKELDHLIELEKKVSKLVNDLLCYRYRNTNSNEIYEIQNYLQSAMGYFGRYSELREAIRLVRHDAGWYFDQDSKQADQATLLKAREDLIQSYNNFIEAHDKILKK